jgi:endonuclease-3
MPLAVKKKTVQKKTVKKKWVAPDTKYVAQVLKKLDAVYPDADCELTWHNPLELLVAVILSAQCTDKRVNLVTPELFARYPTAKALAESEPGEVEALIRTTGFFRNKAKNIRAAAARIVSDFGGKVPKTMDELLTLPGAARKTANVVLGVAYGIAVGVVVDTHVMRLSQRLGLTAETTPEKIEQNLLQLLPQNRWVKFSHQLIWHGRRVCFARKPNCEGCTLNAICPSAFVAG